MTLFKIYINSDTLCFKYMQSFGKFYLAYFLQLHNDILSCSIPDSSRPQISSISSKDYHVATVLGLLPAQTINVYLGSTLRSMHEVLNDNETKLTGYITFVVEVSFLLSSSLFQLCDFCLIAWIPGTSYG